ncbi:hypothetical protein P3F83_01105 [Mycobacteroides immunogenum]|uniref:hypothetical protein n=1 Tax=Mycobacteroides immunogenum TaxID=83262 RepID=UPI0025B783FC|nr:hypothetical protein [Mycobacteroides immunogenum]WJR34083.1 hypothetical protein P3F83_01105 [Mycobacteroides immunogenum]
MNNNTQSRTGTTVLESLVIASVVGLGVVGCSAHPTTPTGAGETSTSAEAHELVDVSAVWATHPLPPCPRVIVGNVSAPVGLELPSDESVAQQLAGVRSPGSESWVREKLGWLTQWLAQTRAGIIDHPETPGSKVKPLRFREYVEHTKTELQAGRDISDTELDGRFPEGCA